MITVNTFKGGVNTFKKTQIKGMTLIVFILLILMSLLPSVNSININIQIFETTQNVIQVDDDGDGDYTSIKYAVENASEGDIIEVYSGTYLEKDILVDKQLTLMGIDSELGNGTGTDKPLIKTGEDDKELIVVTVDGCDISGFHLKTTGCCSAGIKISKSNYNIIHQNDIEHINFGIEVTQSSYNIIYENNVQYTYYAIVIVYNSHNNEIFNNYAYDNSYGIDICNNAENNTAYNNTAIKSNGYGIGTDRANNNEIYNNIIKDCNQGIGLHVDGEDNGNTITVYGNYITSCSRGIMVTGRLHKIYQNNITNCEYGIRMEKIETLPPIQCCQNKVYENNIRDSSHTGICLKGVYTSDIFRNNITGSEIEGLLLEKAELNDIFENDITYNKKYGIWSDTSENNVIYHNNIINPHNVISLGEKIDNHNKWNLPLTKDGGGNYWNDYKGKDRNGDNVGDIPYIIPDGDYNLFNNDMDKYPLMEPNGRPKTKTYIYTILKVKLSDGILDQYQIIKQLLLQ